MSKGKHERLQDASLFYDSNLHASVDKVSRFIRKWDEDLSERIDYVGLDGVWSCLNKGFGL